MSVDRVRRRRGKHLCRSDKSDDVRGIEGAYTVPSLDTSQYQESRASKVLLRPRVAFIQCAHLVTARADSA